MFQERRRAERIEILGHLGGEVRTFQPLAIAEVSLGGVQVETEFPLQIDSLHHFRLTLGDVSVVVEGRITHCRINDVGHERVVYRAGVELINPSEHVQNALQHCIQRVKGFPSVQ